jgi:cytochrome P450
MPDVLVCDAADIGRARFESLNSAVMQDARLTDDFDPLAPETWASAHEEYTRLRGECPVAHSTAFNGFWSLFRYDDVADVLRQPELFITSVQNVVPKVAFTGRRPPLHFDPPEHTPYRRALNPFFTEAKMRKLEPAVRRIVIDLLDPLIRAGGGDVCSEFARKLPGYVFAEFFNLPAELSMAIKETTVVYNRALQSADDELVKETSLRLYEIARRIIEMRKAEPMDPVEDPTSAMLVARGNDGELLPEPLVLGTIRQMIVVGMIAPSVLVPCIMIHLAEHPELQDRLRSNPDEIPAAVEEYLRLYTPYRGFARTAKQDFEVGGRPIRKDEPIALVYASANRDEAVFENPHEFILNRPNIGRHLAFGAGPHRCAGMPLARMMLRVTLEEMLKEAQIVGITGEVVMTRWPEWGALTAPVKLAAIRTERNYKENPE